MGFRENLARNPAREAGKISCGHTDLVKGPGPTVVPDNGSRAVGDHQDLALEHEPSQADLIALPVYALEFFSGFLRITGGEVGNTNSWPALGRLAAHNARARKITAVAPSPAQRGLMRNFSSLMVRSRRRQHSILGRFYDVIENQPRRLREVNEANMRLPQLELR